MRSLNVEIKKHCCENKYYREDKKFIKKSWCVAIIMIIIIMATSCANKVIETPTEIPAITAMATLTITPEPDPTEVPWGVFQPVTEEPLAYMDKNYCNYDGTLVYENWKKIWQDNGFTVVYGERKLTEVPLENYAVLILYLPSPALWDFTNEDSMAVINYVEKGGQLFLLTQYSSVEEYNSAAMANKIAIECGRHLMAPAL